MPIVCRIDFLAIMFVSMGFMSRLFSSGEKSVLGIDIGSSSIKVVELRRQGGKAVLQTYGELALGPYANTEIGRATNLEAKDVGKALADLLRECKATSKTCGVAIPFNSSLISIIEIPAVSQRELATIVPIEARKYIPVPIAEVSLDWSVIPRSKDAPDFNQTAIKDGVKKDKIDVLMVAIHNDTIKRYQDIVKAANLEALFFEIEIFSTIRALLENNPEPVMVLDMGAASTKLYIVERGIIRNSHTINKGSQDITLSLSSVLGISIEQAELLKRGLIPPRAGQETSIQEVFSSVLGYIFTDTQRVLLNYQKKYGKSLNKVYLVGGGVKLRGFIEDARKGLQVDVIPGDPFSKVEMPAFLQSMVNVTGPEFTVAVGIALRRLQDMG